MSEISSIGNQPPPSSGKPGLASGPGTPHVRQTAPPSAESSDAAKALNRRKVIDRRAGNSDATEIDERRQTERRQALAGTDSEEAAQHEHAKQRRLLASCEKVNLLMYSALTLEGYPDDWELDQARKTRDLFLLASCVVALGFILGVGGFFHAIVAGLCAGLSAILAFIAFSPLQAIITQNPSYIELVAKRRALVNQALAHTKMLEEGGGLAWRCEGLGEYNRHIYAQQYAALIRLSKAGQLTSALSNKRHFRLYLQFLIEAQKAYKLLQKSYLSHQSLIDT